MSDSDQIFWDRVIDMPAWEAEQELVARREENILVSSMLMSERAKAKSQKERDDLMAERDRVQAQNTRINERIKYLRNLQDKVRWKNAVLALFGQEAYEECAAWMAQQYQEIDDRRREWRQ